MKTPSNTEMRVQFFFQPERPLQWPIRYMGQPSIKKDSSTNVPVAIRSVCESPVTAPIDFLESLGFMDNFEYIRKGRMYTHPLDISISISQIDKLQTRRDTSTPISIHQETFLVEVSALTADSTQTKAVENVRIVVKQLASHVALCGVSMKDLRRGKGE
tara:strand:+ start:1125 stop:1601 length:477 start_codon:yes stop_codon:yes gene_type:complete